MKALVVIHSQSGNTAAFARGLAHNLRLRGHNSDVALLRPQGRLRPRMGTVSLARTPSIEGYDTLLCGGPVWGFTASPVILTFLRLQESLHGIRVFNFVTKGLPFAFTGGSQALAAMNREAHRAGATLIAGHIQFRAHNTGQTLNETVDALGLRLIQMPDAGNRFDDL